MPDCLHGSPARYALLGWLVTPLRARPATAGLHRAFDFNPQRTQAVPFAGLAGGAIHASGFRADVPESTACGLVVAVGLQVGGKLVAEAI